MEFYETPGGTVIVGLDTELNKIGPEGQIAMLRARIAELESLLEYEKQANKNNVELYERRCRELEADSKAYRANVRRLVEVCKDLYLPSDEDERLLKQAIAEVECINSPK